MAIRDCYYLEKERKWHHYNSLPSNMEMDGLSGIGTEAGVYSFSKTGSAFLPKGKNTWVALSTPDDFYFSCPVQISRTEILVMGGIPRSTHGKEVWKLDINTWNWKKMNDLKAARQGFGCSAYKHNGQTQYVLVAGKN